MKKRIRSVFFKMYIRLAQKQYKRLKYLFQRKASSDTLIVCFSGFSKQGQPAKYNYINTLRSINANKLFILDDFGYNKQGSYYLGENGDWFLPHMVISLIEKLKSDNHIKKLIMIGSSKGGSAALFYGVKMEATYCIIGAPQYYLGNYLSIDKHLPILEGIMGNKSHESINKLNNVIRQCILSATACKPKIHIHFSPTEHTYPEHIKDMINDMRTHGYIVEEDANYTYTEHESVASYFPKYLLMVLKNNI